MPRIFELRSCLQEVQDSLFASFDQHEHDSRSLKSTHPNPIKPDSNWLEDSFNPLGSESEIIKIPGKGFFKNTSKLVYSCLKWSKLVQFSLNTSKLVFQKSTADLMC